MMIRGQCSECGGLVEVPDVWFGTVPPIPTCGRCGAVEDIYPVIKMKPRPKLETATEVFARLKQEPESE